MESKYKGVKIKVEPAFGNTFYSIVGDTCILHPGDWKSLGESNAWGYASEQAAKQATIAKINSYPEDLLPIVFP